MSDSLQNLAQSRTFVVRGGTMESISQAPGQGAEQRTLNIGAVIESKYKVLALIGHGGMGDVYKVHHLLLKKDMALKTFRSHNVTEEAWQRFQREARAIAKLKHKNIVEVFDFGITESGLPYYTMELLIGQSLAELIGSHGALDLKETLRIFLQAGAGLAHAHAHDIVHRDIKPANIFLQNSLSQSGLCEVKIVDFGIAKLSEDLDEGASQSVTQEGTIFGSPLYMSPEQSLGLPLDGRTDIYSFGCALFETITGVPPFVGTTALETLMLHQTKSPPSLKSGLGDQLVPQRLEGMIKRLLTKNVNERYQSFAEVQTDLNVCAKNLEEQPRQSDTVSKNFSDRESAQSTQGTTPGRISGLYKMLAALAVIMLLSGAWMVTLKHHVSKPSPKSLSNAAPVTITTVVEEPTAADIFKKQRQTELKNTASYVIEERPDELICEFPAYGSIGKVIYKGKTIDCVGRVVVHHKQFIEFIAEQEICRSPQLLNRFPSDFCFSIKLARQSDDCRWTVGVMPYLLKQKNLEWLDISFCSEFDASCLKSIGQFEHLTKLDVSYTNISGGDLTGLKNLSQLQILTANKVKDMPRLFSFLAKNPGRCHIQRFICEGCNLDDSCFYAISKLTSLHQLHLGHNNIKGETLALLKHQPALGILSINENNITTEGVRSIAQIKQLERLNLSGQSISKDDLSFLHKQLPKCDIQFLDKDSESWGQTYKPIN